MFPDLGSECSPSRAESECSTAKLPIIFFSENPRRLAACCNLALSLIYAKPALRHSNAAGRKWRCSHENHLVRLGKFRP